MEEIKIKCPHCGAEYLPAEVYYPDEFLGNPTDITKDRDGKIVWFEGTNMWLTSTYVCDKCKKKFQVDASIDFKSKPIVDLFDKDYSTKIK